MNAKSKHKKKLFIKVILFFLLILIVSVAAVGYSYYRKIYSENVRIRLNDEYVYIPTGSTFDDVVRILTKENVLIDSSSFEWLAEKKKYTTQIKPGRYKIHKGMNNNELVNLLRSGKQEPVKLVIRSFRNYRQLAGFVGSKLEADSASVVSLFENEMLAQKYGLTPETFILIILPNTYEFYWNTSADEFISRMAKEYKSFWTEERKEKAQKAGLTQSQVGILASIIQLETNKVDEMPNIAGVYLNRIRIGMRLQADPTVIYAVGDYSIRRVTQEYLEYNSPFNTYIHEGLPPGPICIPYTHSMDAVLNYQLHNFLYFCARDDFSGYHVFAKNLSEHLINARKYQRELNKRNIY